MAVEISMFGKTKQGQEAELYTLRNGKGMEAAVTNYGAILVRVLVPDARGVKEDVVLGFDDIAGYWNNPSYFGAVIGPSANRIGGASFELDGVICSLDTNDNTNNLHSHAEKGYHKQLWNTEAVGEDSVTFSLQDTDGNMGFPGNKKIRLTYRLDEDNGLILHYHGCSDKNTILNLTNHSYFNLEGHKAGKVGNHLLQMQAGRFTPADACSIPTGEIISVQGTPMDFTVEKQIDAEVDADFEQLKMAGGYDHNWVIDNWDGTLRPFATVKAPESGRVMTVSTTLPGVQFYVGNFIVKQSGKEDAVYGKRAGLCLETQYFPDSIHHDSFPSCVFGADREYDSVTEYRFSTL